MHYRPAPQHQFVFADACELFNQGKFYAAVGTARKMFAIDIAGSDIGADIFWCDHLSTLTAIHPGIVEFTLWNSKLHCMVQCDQLRARTISLPGLCHAINLMLHSGKLGNLRSGPLLFDVGDGLLSATPAKVAYCSRNDADILVPDPEFAFSNGYETLKTEAIAFPEWQDRADKVVWRGATTGQAGKRDDPARLSDWDWLPRLKLCAVAAASRQAEFLDVGISQIVQLDTDLADEVKLSGFIRPPMKRQDFGMSRYTVDIDGNSNAWSSLFTKLLMGCCVLKVASPFGFKQWYYEQLQPWIHYVPITAVLTDFDVAIERLRLDPTLGEAIAFRGQNLARGIALENSLAKFLNPTQHNLQD